VRSENRGVAEVKVKLLREVDETFALGGRSFKAKAKSGQEVNWPGVVAKYFVENGFAEEKPTYL